MARNIICTIALGLMCLSATGQDGVEYLKANAIRIDNPNKLSDSIYHLLSPFEVIMFGEMHGTNESTPFVNGLVSLLTANGDSVQVGLEISLTLMTQFILQRTDSSIYQSDFFRNPPFMDGKESVPWATLIAKLNRNAKVNIFFFDVAQDETKSSYQRDSLMFVKIKTQFMQHPSWKMVTLSGNYHNRIEGATMTSFLKQDKELNLSSKICSLNLEYKEGTCMANFSGEGFKKKELGSYPSVYNSTTGYDNYLLLVSPKSNYEYNGMYYIKYITAATMTAH